MVVDNIPFEVNSTNAAYYCVTRAYNYVWPHTALGYSIVISALIALLLRIPYDPFKKFSIHHPKFGMIFQQGCYLMPLFALFIRGPANWSSGDGRMVIFFIFSMYCTLVVGNVSIRMYQQAQDKSSVNYLKWIHGAMMFYAWVMLVGAGIAFSTNLNRQNERTF
jgi:hypothetical protein